MFLLLLPVFLLQADGAEPRPRSGLEAGVVFLGLDPALGAKDRMIQGLEGAFQMHLAEPAYSIGLRAYYRRWDDVEFDEFEQLSADLEGDVQQLGLNLLVMYPLAGPLSLNVELGGGGFRIEHDLDKESAWFFEGGAYLRVDLIAGLYLQAGAAAFTAFTEFGGQDDDTDHLSWTGRVAAGLEIDF